MPHRCHLTFLLGLVLACGSTYAAGLLEGFTPVTVTEGLLFGLTHPLTGSDHLGDPAPFAGPGIRRIRSCRIASAG